MRTRRWSLRKKIAALLLLSLAVLWVAAIGAVMRTAPGPTTAQAYQDNARLPAEELVTQLQRERAFAVVYLGGGRKEPRPLTEQRVRTDAALATFRRLASGPDLAGAASAPVRLRLQELSAALETLGGARETVDRGELDRAGAVRLYTAMIDAAYRLFPTLTDLGDPELARQGRVVGALGRARDMLAQEDALIAGVAAAGTLTSADHTQLTRAIAVQRARFADALAELPEVHRTAYQNVLRAEPAVRLRALEDGVVAARNTGRIPVDLAEWRISYDSVAAQLRDLEAAAGQAAATGAQPAVNRTLAGLWLPGILTLAVAVVFVVVAPRLGRSPANWRGRPRGAPPHPALGPLYQAAGLLRRGADAVWGAAGPAAPAWRREGLDAVYLTLALRSQELLHRQLALIDVMQRRATEPPDLEDLFRVDHLAARLRRHVENLVVLAGAVPGRGWRKPVPMIDVIRGAVSEVEDYARVTTLSIAEVGLVGRAVGDTMHLLAELIENGASFSPPEARVQVSGDLVPNGFVIEIEDRGVGMTTEAIAEANRRLDEPPEPDPASPKLGLLVVARLAGRHGIHVQLRPSPYGGLTAVVLVPPELVAVGPDDPPTPALTGRREHILEVTPVEVTAPADTGGPAAPGPVLPRRIPQASLAAQLRDSDQPAGTATTGRAAGSEPVPVAPAGAHSPERTRAQLSAFQAGMTRGRRRLPVPEAPPAPAAGGGPAGDPGRRGD